MQERDHGGHADQNAIAIIHPSCVALWRTGGCRSLVAAEALLLMRKDRSKEGIRTCTNSSSSVGKEQALSIYLSFSLLSATSNSTMACAVAHMS